MQGRKTGFYCICRALTRAGIWRQLAAAFLLSFLAISAFGQAAHAHGRHWYHRHPIAASAAPSDPIAAIFGFGVATPFASAGFEMNAGAYSSKSTCYAMVKAHAEALGVPVNVALAVTHYESGCHMGMRGRAGERGAMQVLPPTARHVGVAGNLYGEAGIDAGMRYLREALNAQSRFGLCAAISAYNHGVGRVACTRYGRTVLALMTAPMRPLHTAVREARGGRHQGYRHASGHRHRSRHHLTV